MLEVGRNHVLVRVDGTCDGDIQGLGGVGRKGHMDLALAKGLEFDHVIVPDAQAETYPDTPLARRRLYTAVSRAMHRVTLISQGDLSPLLTQAHR